MAKDPDIKPKWRKKLLKRLESIKWYLWHGNVFETLQETEFLENLCYGDYEEIDEDAEFDLELEISPYVFYFSNTASKNLPKLGQVEFYGINLLDC